MVGEASMSTDGRTTARTRLEIRVYGLRVKHPLWNYVGPASGILFVVLSLAGFAIHGYPSGNGAEIKHWIATTNATRFAAGIWIEALGYLFLLPFAAWLVRDLRRPGVVDWPADVAFGAAVLCTGSALLINGIWTGLVDAGRGGIDPNILVAIKFVATDAFSASALFYGLFIVAVGVTAVAAKSLPPWLAWAAVVIGVLGLIPPTSLPAFLALDLWILAVSGRAGMDLRTPRPSRTRRKA
jgi:hypothetical protein